MFGVREPNTDRVKKLLSDAPGKTAAGSNRDAVAYSEVVFLTLPWAAAEAAIAECGPLEGKIVVDCTNPVKLGATNEMLELGFDTSAGEKVAEWAVGAQVFKTLNQVGWEIMAEPRFPEGAAVMFVAGPGGAAKATVMKLVDELGFEAIDIGGIALARILEPFAMVWIHSAIAMGAGRDWAFCVARRSGP